MWGWLLERGPKYVAQGIVNYAARCPAIPACPSHSCGDCVVPPLPSLSELQARQCAAAACRDWQRWEARGPTATMSWSYVLYNVDGPALWHHRRVHGVVAHSANKLYVATTPDAHVYAEDWSTTSQDVLAVRAGVQWLLAVEAGGQVVAAADGGVAAGGALPAAAAGATVPAGAPAGGAVGTTWRAAESGGGYRFGDVVNGHVRSNRAAGSRDIHLLADGGSLFVEEVTPATQDSFFDTAVMGDARGLAVRRNRQGRRERTWAEMVSAVVQEDFAADWDLPGPRSTLWCLELVNQEGLGLDGHHERFRYTCKLEFSGWGVSEHYSVTQALKLGLLHDQVDGSNLMMVECLFRRIQTIEFAHSERAREQEAKGHGGKLSLEEQMAFAGTSRAGGSLMICPLLLDCARSEVEREASLAKNLRKAREERESARAKDKLGKKDNG
ncbi:unnamed protein product [Prorocentrum cordatum]|uniref:Uncharacterized protein n=1 Tax=Prorocentrum cordatum TaxID=2364126 RepID=A0ABN9T5W5_9DINO|nr:unnamed protein product [Polarella glacialis]